MTLVELAKSLRAQLEAAAQYLPEEKALENRNLYPVWKPGMGVEAGRKYRYGGGLFRCVTAHTTQGDWTPDKVPALWEVIPEQQSGELNDPISACRGMKYMQGLYYRQGNQIYRCIRDSVVPLYYLPDELEGQYFEMMTEEE